MEWRNSSNQGAGSECRSHTRTPIDGGYARSRRLASNRPMATNPDSIARPELMGRRSDGRAHDRGMTRPYRPCPPDFRERYLELGWDAIVDHYRTNCRVISRWIEEAGGEALRADRFALAGARTGGKLRPRSRAARHVLGLTLSGKTGSAGKIPKGGNATQSEGIS